MRHEGIDFVMSSNGRGNNNRGEILIWDVDASD